MDINPLNSREFAECQAHSVDTHWCRDANFFDTKRGCQVTALCRLAAVRQTAGWQGSGECRDEVPAEALAAAAHVIGFSAVQADRLADEGDPPPRVSSSPSQTA